MEAIIKETQTLIGALGTYARLVIVGVWFPGFLILCELSYLYGALYLDKGDILFTSIAQRIKEFDSAVVTTLIVVFVLAVSIALGYVARDVAFAVSDFWLRRKWPPTRGLIKIFREIKYLYNDDKVDQIARQYSVFRLAYGNIDVQPLPRSPDSYVREFCKQWLKVKAPLLNTEGLEIEINMVIGLVIPVALSSLVFISHMKDAVGIGIAVVSILAATLMIYRITWARDLETEQAIVNFLFAHWEPSATSLSEGAKPADPSP